MRIYKQPEPTMLGVRCDGPNLKHAEELKARADAYILLAKFYTLERKDQLLIAAMCEELVRDRDDD